MKNNPYRDIPHILRQKDRWVLFRLVPANDGKMKKIPYSIDGSRASVTNPATWSSFERTIEVFQNGDWNGIGFVLTGTEIICMDIDHCRDLQTGSLKAQAQHCVDIANSYTEISPSGTGLHIFLCGVLPKGARRNDKTGCEMYGDGSPRFIAMTGNRLNALFDEIRIDQSTIDTLHRLYIAKEVQVSSVEKHVEKHAVRLSVQSYDAAQLVQKACNARNGAKFRRLYCGEISDYGNDHSRADQAVCNMLAFWTKKDPILMDQIFRQSGLMRSKWDERHGAKTYGEMTIENAIFYTGRTYNESK